MAVDDDGHAGGLGANVEVFTGVDHVDQEAGKVEEFGGGKEGAGAVSVDVAADGGDGGDAGEGGQDFGVSYVAGVEDVVNAGQGGEELRAEEAMGVGEYADEHL